MSEGKRQELQTINATQAAKLLGIGRTTVYEMARAGEIPCAWIGKRVVFDKGSLIEWWRDRERESRAAKEAPTPPRKLAALRPVADWGV